MSRKNNASAARVVAYDGGEFRFYGGDESDHEVVLALPLSRLLVRMVRVPPGTDPVEYATPVLQKLTPFPDEPLTVSCETARETPDGTVVIAAALPESAADDVAEKLDAAKLNVTRIDALVLGELRRVWQRLGVQDGTRRLVKIKSADGIALVVLDGDQPSSIRSVADDSEMRRETTLSLLEAEDFGGTMPLADTVEIEASDDALVGVAERSADPETLNALPASWAEVLAETRFKAKLVRRVAVAGTVWALIMAVLIGVPFGYGYLTDRQRAMSKAHSRRYQEVKTLQDKVELVRRFSDNSRGALEVMRAVSERVPEDVTLKDWSYDHEKGLRFSARSTEDQQAYDFKDAMEALAFEDGTRVFESVKLEGLSMSKGEWRFGLDLQFKAEEAE